MSSFGAHAITMPAPPYEKSLALVSSANKCLESTPGLAFIIAHRDTLHRQTHSLCFDVLAHHRHMEEHGQFLYTPPVQVVAALEQALSLHEQEGGCAARLRRYQENQSILVQGMRALGFQTTLDDSLFSGIIVSFHIPPPPFAFQTFYDALYKKGFLIYHKKTHETGYFRVGCIGQIHAHDMRAFIDSVTSLMPSVVKKR
ncbi:MAG: hypothetical protein GDA54_00085 [Alphaproteobacteria bacterium GM7ARS4]|nr:hypothetical protein [Alphaproteobacteria bacterium GM7ARS4]